MAAIWMSMLWHRATGAAQFREEPAEIASGLFRVRPENEIAQLLQQPFLISVASRTGINSRPKFAQYRDANADPMTERYNAVCLLEDSATAKDVIGSRAGIEQITLQRSVSA